MAHEEKTCGVLAAAGNEKSLTVILLALRDAREALQATGPEVKITQARTMEQVRSRASSSGPPPGILILSLPLKDDETASGGGAGAAGWIEEVFAIAGRKPGSQIVLLANREICGLVAYRCSRSGQSNIHVFSLPLRRQTLAELLRSFLVFSARAASGNAELVRLRAKVNDMGVISRAKCLLIQNERMTEDEAHHSLERRAMDDGISKREAAEEIIRRYSY